MMRTVIIGFGFMGQTHAGNILKTQNVELCAIVDRTPLEKVLKSSGGNFNTGLLGAEAICRIPYFDDTEKCLNEIKPDAAIICLPTFLHYDATRLCLEHGCHVLLEKPICLDIAQAEEMIRLAATRQRTFMVAHCVRFFAEYELLKNTIAGNRLGKLKLLKMSRSSGEPSWGCWQEKQVKANCGGALFDLLIHDIDFLNYALGQPEKIWNPPPLAGAFSTGYINSVWEYSASGVTAVVEGGNCYPPRRPFECGYSGIFENGAILYSSFEPGKVKFITENNVTIEDLSGEKSGYLKELEYFITCAVSRQYPEKCPPEDALTAIRLCYRHLEQ
ncbi:MAG: Gfo/Idh/MocA family oxidoreductase [Victivallaceae bacterium]